MLTIRCGKACASASEFKPEAARSAGSTLCTRMSAPASRFSKRSRSALAPRSSVAPILLALRYANRPLALGSGQVAGEGAAGAGNVALGRFDLNYLGAQLAEQFGREAADTPWPHSTRELHQVVLMLRWRLLRLTRHRVLLARVHIAVYDSNPGFFSALIAS